MSSVLGLFCSFALQPRWVLYPTQCLWQQEAELGLGVPPDPALPLVQLSRARAAAVIPGGKETLCRAARALKSCLSAQGILLFTSCPASSFPGSVTQLFGRRYRLFGRRCCWGALCQGPGCGQGVLPALPALGGDPGGRSRLAGLCHCLQVAQLEEFQYLDLRESVRWLE